MRVALVVPPWTPEDIRARDTRGISGCWPTPGLLYVASALREAGHAVRFLEGFFYSNDEMRRMIADFGADALGIYVISLLWDNARSLLEAVRKDSPSVFTFIGGHGASAMPERMLQECPSLDAVVVGEGEVTSVELLEAAERGAGPSKVRGVFYRDDSGEIRASAPRPLLHDISSLPFPAVDLCEMSRYYPSFEQVSTVPAVQMLASRGCTGTCLYCYKMYGRKIRLRDPVRVVDEMEHYVRSYGAREIKFWDEHFTYSHEHVRRICDEITKRGLSVRWWVSCRADSVDKRILRTMKEAGCWCINFGVESGVQKNLDTLRKRETLERIRLAIRMAHSVGLKTHSTYIFGIPGETYREGLETIRFALELGSFTVEFFPFTPFPGTPAYKGIQRGEFGRMSVDLRDQGMLLDRPCFVPFTMTADEIMKLRRLAYVRYFLRPGFLVYRFTNIMSAFQLRAIFHGALSILQMILEQVSSVWRKRESA
ncbi:cobalamin-dependent protein [Candidatus Fermentibacterales bacterium]|nr:cobalamin-dependent protein [Candidatus Fermentibacterales bacterium]